MATADGGRSHTRQVAQASQACINCKIRKKKCNKFLPSCGYCIGKELACGYDTVPNARKREPIVAQSSLTELRYGFWLPPNNISYYTNLPTKFPLDQRDSGIHHDEIYLAVHSIIRGTGQFVDDISARYFQGLHRHLPIISRPSFYQSLTKSATDSAADTSVLLLAICLVTHAPALGYPSDRRSTERVEQQHLYLIAKSLFAQVQVFHSSSIQLIQAGILLALYEYRQGRPNDAFVTIAGCARLAYAAQIHIRCCLDGRTPRMASQDPNTDVLLQNQEAANAWWVLVMCERMFFSDLEILDQPLVTIFPDGDALLPIDHQVLDQLDILGAEALQRISLSSSITSNIRGMGRSAQAFCLLDHVLKSFNTPDIDLRLFQLDSIDAEIQGFLSSIMPPCQEQTDVFCFAISIMIRTLFMLHNHVLALHPQAVRAKFKPIEEWWKRSQEALDTVTKIVVDVATTITTTSSTESKFYLIDSSPPTYPYIAHAALRHLCRSKQGKDVDWVTSAQAVLQTSLVKYYERWSVGGDIGRSKMSAEKGYEDLPP